MVVVTRAVCAARHRIAPGNPLADLWRQVVAQLPLSPRLLAIIHGQLEHDDAQPHASHTPNAPDLSAALIPTPGDQSFNDLFLQYRLPLVEFICGMTRDRDWAADLAQDVFVRAFAARQTHAHLANPRAWLYRIATNLTLNALRHQRHFTWLPLGRVEPEAGRDDSSIRAVRPTLPPLAWPAEDVAITVTERDAVWSVLAALPPLWRAVLLLQTTNGFSVDEIAVLLHLSKANVRKILYRAKERFRETYIHLGAQATPKEAAREGGPA